MTAVSGARFFEQMVEQVASGNPCVALLGWDGYCYLATAVKRLPFAESIEQPLARADGHGAKIGPMLEWPARVALASYDDSAPNFMYEITEAISVKKSDLVAMVEKSAASKAGWALAEAEPHSKYLVDVERIQEDIRSGRFYQLNYLRYFTVRIMTQDVRERLARLIRWGGAMSAVVIDQGIDLWSFSPERFIKCEPNAAGLATLHTYPIKGTAAHAGDPLGDSRKDQAELNMIIDLMRNDLLRVCERGSVEVVSAGERLELSSVTHRVAHIQGRLRTENKFKTILAALCPGGSITGAPKQEVMQAIQEYEGRSRGYFMGNIFYWQPTTGRIDSNILIRTMWRDDPQKPYGYAAGSGIVIGSQSNAELEEVGWKCRVLTASTP